MTRGILTVTLNPALDRTVIVENFTLGRSHFKEREFVSAGGKGLNVSRALKGLGIESMATGLLGGDAAYPIKRLLRQEEIRHRFVKIRGNCRVNFMVLDKARIYQRTRILGVGPKIRKSEIRLFQSLYQRLLKKSSVVILSGRKPSGVSDKLYAHLIDTAHSAGVSAFLDTSGAPLMEGFKAKPYLVKPNQEELEQVFGVRLGTIKSQKQVIQRLHRMGIKIILLSLGQKGAIGSDGNEIWLARCPKVKLLNDVGCGDSFISGYCYSFLKKQTFPKSLKTAVAAGTVNAMSFTPGLITKNALKTMLGKIEIFKL